MLGLLVGGLVSGLTAVAMGQPPAARSQCCVVACLDPLPPLAIVNICKCSGQKEK